MINNQTIPHYMPYCRCCACGRILPDAEWKNISVEKQTPCCGINGDSREIWPPLAVSTLLETASQADLDSPAKIQIAAVYLCFAVEMIIEDILISCSKIASRNNKESVYCPSKGRNLEDMMLAYEKLSGTSMANRFESLGAGDFMSDIRQLFCLREKIVQDKDYKAQQSEKRAVLSVQYWGLKYFSLLSNNLCSNSMKKTPEKTLKKKVKSVLVVDDELVVLDFMCKLVKRHGLSVFSAATGTEGLKMFKENNPDCVLLDIALPDMDGLSVLKGIKDINPAAIVHMVTGIGGEAIEKQAGKLGATGYISKPVEPGILTEILNKML